MKYQQIWADLRVALLYALFGGVWILFSDRILESFTSDVSTLSALQTYKGWFYVITSALLLFFLLRSEAAHRRAAEVKLQEKEERYRLLFENSLDAIMLTKPDGNILSANPAACKLFERTEQELKQLGRNGVVDLTDPRVNSAVSERSRTGFFRGVLTFVRRDGSKFEGDISSILFKDEDGNVRTSMIIRDITDLKAAEAQIQKQVQRLNGLRIIDQSIKSVLSINTVLDIVLQKVLDLLNADAAAILLLNKEKQNLEYIVGKGFYTESIRHSQIPLGDGLAGKVGFELKSLHIPDLKQVGDKFLRAQLLQEDEFVEYIGVPLVAKGNLKGVLEIFQRTHKGLDDDWFDFLEILADQAAIAIENGQLFGGLQKSNLELEQRVKERTADLMRMNTELEHASRAKDEFLANMSHELRTPLTSILGMAESLEANTYGQLNEKQARSLKNIETSGHHLLSLINDILDLSKADAGKLDIHPEEINVEETCQSCLVFVREQAFKKFIKLEYEQVDHVETFFADPRRFKQIMVNLLNNAVKFTPENGQVKLSVQADPKLKQIRFSVSDTGIGIAAKDMQHLFTPFTQLDSRLNRQYEGTGLGLALVWQLVELHGGSVQVESEVGKGSTFTVSLSWQPKLSELPEPEQNDSAASTTGIAQGLLLLVEDNETNIEAITDYLIFRGYSLVTASNGMEALVKAEEHNPQLILMDVQMPVMDGLEATRRLRENPRFASMPIIALTALAMPGDRERCLQAGATDYMSKPVSPKELVNKIMELLSNGAHS